MGDLPITARCATVRCCAVAIAPCYYTVSRHCSAYLLPIARVTVPPFPPSSCPHVVALLPCPYCHDDAKLNPRPLLILVLPILLCLPGTGEAAHRIFPSTSTITASTPDHTPLGVAVSPCRVPVPSSRTPNRAGHVLRVERACLCPQPPGKPYPPSLSSSVPIPLRPCALYLHPSGLSCCMLPVVWKWFAHPN